MYIHTSTGTFSKFVKRCRQDEIRRRDCHEIKSLPSQPKNHRFESSTIDKLSTILSPRRNTLRRHYVYDTSQDLMRRRDYQNKSKIHCDQVSTNCCQDETHSTDMMRMIHCKIWCIAVSIKKTGKASAKNSATSLWWIFLSRVRHWISKSKTYTDITSGSAVDFQSWIPWRTWTAWVWEFQRGNRTWISKSKSKSNTGLGSLNLKVSFAEFSLFYRALLQKRPVILRSLVVVATP